MDASLHQALAFIVAACMSLQGHMSCSDLMNSYAVRVLLIIISCEANDCLHPCSHTLTQVNHIMRMESEEGGNCIKL